MVLLVRSGCQLVRSLLLRVFDLGHPRPELDGALGEEGTVTEADAPGRKSQQ